MSYIQLADSKDGDGRLYARDIGRWSLPKTQLVILSACDTAAGTVYRAEGMVSLVRPFLASGVPTIVATLWRIKDNAAFRLMSAFHENYARHSDAVRALADAQRRFLAERQPMGHVRDWAAFVVFSGSQSTAIAPLR
jgi:CHAT domain-containing protein